MSKISSGLEYLKSIKTYWRQPAPGKYMPFKEIFAYAGGGIGVYFVIDIVNKMILSTNNVLIGNTIGIAPTDMYIMYIIGVISSFPLTALRANIVDNTRGKKGKYRPYIVTMGIPCALLAIGFVWVPYEKLSYITSCIIILLFNIGFQFFFSFFKESYENLIHVLSPDSQERTNVLGFKSVVYSLAPTIINAVLPIIAQKYFNNDMTDINLYRYVYPPLAILGVLLSIVVYANTNEKVIRAKTHIIKVNFIDALKAVAKNKYFWIISFAGWLGFLEGFYVSVLYWLYQYQGACSGNEYSLIVTLYGNGSLWGMLLAPWAIKRFGKKKVLIVTNTFNIIFIACLYPSLSNIWIVLIFLYCNAIVGAFAHVLDPAIQGDIRDYQQYITGERIDGMFSAVGLIGSVVSMITSGVLPLVYKNHGIYSGNGYENMYDILYDGDIFKSLMTALIMFSILGAAMNVIPYFFYDLTETKQKSIVKILKIRAFFEDYENGLLDNDKKEEVADIINNVRRTAPLDKTAINSELKNQGKQKVKEARALNDEIEISGMVLEEIQKYGTKLYTEKLKDSERIVAMGLEGFTNIDSAVLTEAVSMPKSTPEEKALRKQKIALIKSIYASKKSIKKHYADGLKEFDDSVFPILFEQEDNKEIELNEAYKAYYDAKDTKDKALIAVAKERLNIVKHERDLITHEINEKTNESARYYRTAKPYLDCKKTIAQAKGYSLIDEMFAVQA